MLQEGESAEYGKARQNTQTGRKRKDEEALREIALQRMQG
jgi:hypothetical protein